MTPALRRIEPADLKRLRDTLDQIAALSLAGKRLRAIFWITHSSALDLADVINLDMWSVIDRSAPRRWTVAPLRYMRFLPRYLHSKRKAIGAHGLPVLTPEAAPYVEHWIRAAAREHKIQWSANDRPLALFHDDARKRLSPRTVQHHFTALQRHARTAGRYRFTDLRTDGIFRYADRGAPLNHVASFARISRRAALVYLPPLGAHAIADLFAGSSQP